ncbi:tail component of prophage CP-933K [Escherichia coli]|nr:tail component of prophage CP-933K [Escherichia coli]CAD5492015.1 tail component of prophage CP-933K [Escherichia coli]
MKTGAEAIRALATQLPAFRQKLSDGWYQVRIAGRDAGETELSSRLNEPLANGAVIHIVPRLAGAKSGGVFQAVLGAALIATAIWMPGISIAFSNILFSMGAAMMLGGVAQMLVPKPKTPRTQTTDNGKQNTYFSSLDNMVAQGNVLPVLYGEMRVGSRVASQEISTADEGDGGQVTDTLGLVTSFSYAGDKNRQLTHYSDTRWHEDSVRNRWFSVMAGPSVRVNEWFSAYAMAGVSYSRVSTFSGDYLRVTDNKGKTHDVLTGSDDGRHSNTSLAWGAGVQFNPTESVAIDIAYEGSGSGDWRTDGFIVGVGYKF